MRLPVPLSEQALQSLRSGHPVDAPADCSTGPHAPTIEIEEATDQDVQQAIQTLD